MLILLFSFEFHVDQIPENNESPTTDKAELLLKQSSQQSINTKQASTSNYNKSGGQNHLDMGQFMSNEQAVRNRKKSPQQAQRLKPLILL